MFSIRSFLKWHSRGMPDKVNFKSNLNSTLIHELLTDFYICCSYVSGCIVYRLLPYFIWTFICMRMFTRKSKLEINKHDQFPQAPSPFFCVCAILHFLTDASVALSTKAACYWNPNWVHSHLKNMKPAVQIRIALFHWTIHSPLSRLLFISAKPISSLINFT